MVVPKLATKKKLIPLSIPYLNGSEKNFVINCLKDNWVSSAGPYVEKFEKKFASIIKGSYAVACSSGTAALHLALKTLNIKEGDLIFAPNLTFIASINVIKYIKADPILVDINKNTLQINIEILEKFLIEECVIKKKICYHKKTGKKVRAIIAVHVLGYPCDLKRLIDISKKYNLFLIEDAAESLGSKAYGRYTGTHGIIGCFSFNGNKTITTGSGGMIVTANKNYAEKAKHLSQQAKEPGNGYIHTEIGYNYRMNNVQAAIGLGQLEDLRFRLEKKKSIYMKYKKELSSLKSISFPEELNNTESSYWLTTIIIDTKKIKKKINQVVLDLEKEKIETRLLWQPMNISKAHKGSIYTGKNFSLSAYKSCLSLPSSLNLKLAEQKRVILELKKILSV